MLRRLFSLLLVLLPLAPFAYAVQVVNEWLSSGRSLHGILLLLGALAVFALIEGLLFKLWLLPSWGQSIGEKLYGGSYLPEQDELALLSRLIRSTEDVSRLPALKTLVLRQRARARGWLELARLQQDIAQNNEEALQTLLEGSAAVSDKEDRAMLLYRAATLAEKQLHAPARAAEYYARTAHNYPNTVYGKCAAAKLSRP